MTLTRRIAAGLLGAAALAPGLASAAACADSVRTDSSALNPSFVACSGSFTGNPGTGTITFGGEHFDFIGKTVNDGTGSGPFGSFGANLTSGSLTFDQARSGSFLVALKAGNGYSLYEFSSSVGVTSIAFDTLGVTLNPKGKPLGLGFAALYASPTSPVPEPATAALLLCGLVGLSLVARRRRQA